ncbi:MAG: flagellar hook-length control protein FliK [Gammaproteobacteria bacterium]|nr:flagellar hook-length control protein FliK [Gammaproteobacteria bacterium]MBU4280669.1 flagellar hook-length control protein FliK [Gammaproteobacteria bacterium]MBU4325775.1 flagellar hook-length control protein FliK [Gammaproteobacteria bacterium]MBU4504921.1 flagellar hook-length control protein FliK [Gammaproteobacteria bacterium]
MSTPATASSGASQAAAPTTRSNATANGQRAGTPAAGDNSLFASLLGLLSATRDLPADGAGLGVDDPPAPGRRTLGQGIDELGEDPALALLPEASDNPLAALLAWPGAPVAMDAAAELPGANPAGTGAASLPAAASAGNENLTGQAGQALATNAEGATGATPLPADMTVLDQPTEPDAQTLAALSRGNAGAEALRNAQGQPATDATRNASGKGAAHPATWHSTTAIGNAAAQSVSTTRQAFNISVTGHTDSLAAQVRSTVTLDDRFNAAATTAPLAAGAAGAGLVSAAMPGADAGSGQPGQSSEQASPEGAEYPLEEADASTPFETLTEEDAAGLGAWNPQNLRQASLRVGEGSEEAIDIRLSLAGEELNVDFRSDNAETRASLQQSAGAQLSDLLARSGIQLGGVSVGAQQQGQGQPGQPGEPGSQTGTRGARAPAASDAGAAASVQAPAQPRPRSDGSQPLDMFV